MGVGQKRNRAAAGVLLCGLAMAVLGASVVVTDSLRSYPAAAGQALRYGIAAGVLGVAVALVPGLRSAGTGRARPTRRQWALLAAVAATGLVAFNLLLLLALDHAQPAAVSTVVGCAPLALVLLGPLTRRARPSLQLVTAAGIVVVGTALVHGAGRSDVVGVLAATGVLAGDVAFSLIAAKLSADLGAARVAAYSCALAVPQLVAVAVATGETAQWRWPDRGEAMAIAFLALVLTAGAFLCWFQGLVWAGVERGGQLVAVVPVTTLLVVAVQHSALPPMAQIVGVVAVGAGLILGLWPERSGPPAAGAAAVRPRIELGPAASTPYSRSPQRTGGRRVL